MELFHEYRNKSMMAFIELAERIANGEIFSAIEFENEYYRLSGDSERQTMVFYKNVVFNDKLPVFNLSDKKRVRLSEFLDGYNNIKISDIPLKTEKYWLYNALSDRLSSLFLSDDEINLLKNKFPESLQYYRNIDDERHEDISQNTAANFRTILHAVNSKKSISYPYKGIRCQVTPVKLEYDQRNFKLYVIIFDGNRFIKTDISKISDISIIEPVFDNVPELAEKMLEKQAYSPIVFTVTDKKNRNAIERALLAFSVYDHIAEPLNKKTVKFTIQYYTMDLDILIKDILSFGADIKVESPKFVVKKITEIIEKF